MATRVTRGLADDRGVELPSVAPGGVPMARRTTTVVGRRGRWLVLLAVLSPLPVQAAPPWSLGDTRLHRRGPTEAPAVAVDHAGNARRRVGRRRCPRWDPGRPPGPWAATWSAPGIRSATEHPSPSPEIAVDAPRAASTSSGSRTPPSSSPTARAPWDPGRRPSPSPATRAPTGRHDLDVAAVGTGGRDGRRLGHSSSSVVYGVVGAASAGGWETPVALSDDTLVRRQPARSASTPRSTPRRSGARAVRPSPTTRSSPASTPRRRLGRRGHHHRRPLHLPSRAPDARCERVGHRRPRVLGSWTPRRAQSSRPPPGPPTGPWARTRGPVGPPPGRRHPAGRDERRRRRGRWSGTRRTGLQAHSQAVHRAAGGAVGRGRRPVQPGQAKSFAEQVVVADDGVRHRQLELRAATPGPA